MRSGTAYRSGYPPIATTAAAIAIERGLAVQDIPCAVLRARRLEDGQVRESR